jgi:hypothetical protein
MIEQRIPGRVRGPAVREQGGDGPVHGDLIPLQAETLRAHLNAGAAPPVQQVETAPGAEHPFANEIARA